MNDLFNEYLKDRRAMLQQSIDKHQQQYDAATARYKELKKDMEDHRAALREVSEDNKIAEHFRKNTINAIEFMRSQMSSVQAKRTELQQNLDEHRSELKLIVDNYGE